MVAQPEETKMIDKENQTACVVASLHNTITEESSLYKVLNHCSTNVVGLKMNEAFAVTNILCKW